MSLESGNVLVTGAAGFIGFHLSERLCRDGYRVAGVDIVNDYYDVALKYSRLKILEAFDNFHFHKVDLNDIEDVKQIFAESDCHTVIHLAAQAGVRYSLENPKAYMEANVNGFFSILEHCRQFETAHLIFASSSSVYGGNTSMPFSTRHPADHPISMYAATKKSNEMMAHAYASMFKLPATGLRFFTAYGPYGRPDMALFLFTKAILEDQPIEVFNGGNMLRDFTYIDDLVEGICRLIKRPAAASEDWDSSNPDPAASSAPYRIYNIGSNNPVELSRFIEIIEECVGKKAIRNNLPMQRGDVPRSYADVDDLVEDIDYKPNTPIEQGVRDSVDWYRAYYKA